MILDKANQVAADYAPTTPFGATLFFQSYIDRLAVQDDGAGTDIECYGLIKTSVTSGGSGTVNFKVIGNPSDPTFAAGNVVLLDTGVIAKTTLVAGYQFLRAKLPRIPLLTTFEPTTAFLRYLTIAAIIGTADLTAGAWDAWITFSPLQDNLSYPAGYSFP